MQIAPFKLHVPFSRFTSETRLVKSVDFLVCHCQHLDFKFLQHITDNKIRGSPCNYYSLELAQFSQNQEITKISFWQAKVITCSVVTTAVSDILSICTSLLACLNFTYLCLDYFGQLHPLSLHLHPKAPPPWLGFLPLQNSSVIKLHGSEKGSWLGNILDNPHSYCKHFTLPKGNPSNGNFHSWFLTSLCFLLLWLTNNDLMWKRWEHSETTLNNGYRTALWRQASDFDFLT